MTTFFEILKIVFFVVSLVIGISGIIAIETPTTTIASSIVIWLLPTFLVLVGMMIAYIIAKMMATYHGNSSPSKRSFMVATLGGIFLGVSLAVLYAYNNGLLQ